MNKKIFAALASATMALSATGSLAVFAEDFDNVGEVTPVIPSNPAEENKVLWNEDNFGELATEDAATLSDANGSITIEDVLDDEGYISTETLESVTSIVLTADFDGEVKGLEYFTKLESFTSTSAGSTIENTSLDFSENTSLETIDIEKGASELSSIVLPNPNEDEYTLETLTLQGTSISSLDLSEQAALDSITVTGGELKNIELYPTTKNKPVEYTTLVLSDNSLEEIDLKNYKIGTLNLSNNHIGVLDLSDTEITTAATLTGQTFYVAADAGTIDLTEYFPSIKIKNVTAGAGAKLVEEDGVKTGELELIQDPANYTYDTDATVGGNPATLSVTITKANPMYRLYNPNSGEHFYTKDVEEKDALVKLGWSDEGIGWVAPLKGSTNAGDPVYRLYNPNAGDHHYTLDENEKNILASIGWKYEGIGWYSAKPTEVKVFREYNPNAKAAGAHNYTTSKTENDFLVSVGWLQEGIGWFALQ